MRTYYVYIYLDPTRQGDYSYEEHIFSFEPFYVGRGFGNRYKYESHIRKGDLTTHKAHRIQSILSKGLEPVIGIVYDNLSFEQSEELECKLIKLIGRLDEGKGTLTNHTHGGKGVPGFIMPPKSPETLNKMSEAQKGKKYSKETNRKKGSGWLGRKHSQEEKDAIASANRGRIFSDEHKSNISRSKSGKVLNLSDSERERRRLRTSKPLPEEVKINGMRTRIRKDIERIFALGLILSEDVFNTNKTRQTCRFSSISHYYTDEEFKLFVKPRSGD